MEFVQFEIELSYTLWAYSCFSLIVVFLVLLECLFISLSFNVVYLVFIECLLI